MFCDVSECDKGVQMITVIRAWVINSMNIIILFTLVYFFFTRMFKLKEKGFFLIMFGLMSVSVLLTACNSTIDCITPYDPLSTPCCNMTFYRTMTMNIGLIWAAYTQAYAYFVVKYYSLALSIEQIIEWGRSDVIMINRNTEKIFYFITFTNVAINVTFIVLYWDPDRFENQLQEQMFGLIMSIP